MDSIPYSSLNLMDSDERESLDNSGQALTDLSGTYLDPELQDLKTSLSDTPKVGSLIALTRTMDQAQVVLAFMDAVSERKGQRLGSGSSLAGTVSLTAGRGRGKSAAVGLCLAGAVSLGLANLFVTAPSPENLKTVFQFFLAGLAAFKYIDHVDYEV